MATGIVKFFDEQKGFGFIEQDDGLSLFFHFSDLLVSGFKTINQDARVTFDVKKNERGLRAALIQEI
jgi:cold shock protein